MTVYRIVNSVFKSCTYVVHSDESRQALIVDCGDVQPIVDYFDENGLKLRYVLLTHSHFDHIYGLNELIQKFPACTVYASEYTIKGLYDAKLNYSSYYEGDFIFHGVNVFMICNDDKIPLWDRIVAKIIATPGHDAGCMTYIVENNIFTGDSYIPGIKTITHLRGNKQQAGESEKLIKQLITERNLIIRPGHENTLLNTEKY